MIDRNRTLCYCNDLSIEEIVTCIKENRIATLEELLEQNHRPVGDKCELCREEGYHNDGYSLVMLLALVKQKRL
ncbi:MAG: hypothetical protein DSZ03_09225 [Sulfurimonas sp.]|nr:MAG: hypothetical protein DSZ03_09225 [Sulfurimonas sp.]